MRRVAAVKTDDELMNQDTSGWTPSQGDRRTSADRVPLVRRNLERRDPIGATPDHHPVSA